MQSSERGRAARPRGAVESPGGRLEAEACDAVRRLTALGPDLDALLRQARDELAAPAAAGTRPPRDAEAALLRAIARTEHARAEVAAIERVARLLRAEAAARDRVQPSGDERRG